MLRKGLRPNITVCWDMVLCLLVICYWCFEGPRCFCLQDSIRRISYCSELYFIDKYVKNAYTSTWFLEKEIHDRDAGTDTFSGVGIITKFFPCRHSVYSDFLLWGLTKFFPCRHFGYSDFLLWGLTKFFPCRHLVYSDFLLWGLTKFFSPADTWCILIYFCEDF